MSFGKLILCREAAYTNKLATCTSVINMNKKDFVELVEKIKVLLSTVKPEKLYTYIYDGPETDDGK